LKETLTEKKKPKVYKIRYAMSHGGGITVSLPYDPRKRVCEACGKSVEEGEIKVTALHHWYYAYQAKSVKENPLLALENTSELCFYDHQLGDAIRMFLYAAPQRVANVARLLKGDQKKHFIEVMKAVILEFESSEKNISPLANRLIDMAKKNGSTR